MGRRKNDEIINSELLEVDIYAKDLSKTNIINKNIIEMKKKQKEFISSFLAESIQKGV